MGYDPVEATLRAEINANGGERTERGERLWAELTERIQVLVDEPRYAEIRVSWEN